MGLAQEKGGGDITQLISAARLKATGESVELVELEVRILRGEAVAEEDAVSCIAERERVCLNLQSRGQLTEEHDIEMLKETQTALNGGRVGVGNYCIAEMEREAIRFEKSLKTGLPYGISLEKGLHEDYKHWLELGRKIDPRNPRLPKLDKRIVRLDKMYQRSLK